MSDSTYDITKIKHHPYIVTCGTDVIGPQKEAPSLEPETELHECIIYENGGKEAVGQYLMKNNETVTLTTEDIDWALEQIKTFKVGDNIMAAANKKTLTFTPVGVTGAKTLVFTNCYLQPGLSYTPPIGGEEHTAKLVFKCLPDPGTKALFTWSAPSA